MKPCTSRSFALGLSRLCATLALLAVLVPAVPAAAQGRNQYLEEGKRLLTKQKPEQAIEELSQALEFPELPIPQRIEILGYLGAAYHLAGDEAKASEAWEERVRLTPDGDLPEELPGQVRSAYVQVRAGVVVVEHLPPPGALAGRTVEIRVNLRDRYAATQDLIVYHRRGGEKEYQETPLERDDLSWHTRLTLPSLAGLTAAYEYEYYVVARSEEGELLHSAGTEDAPLSIRVMAPTEDPGPMTATLPDPLDPIVEPGVGSQSGTGAGLVIVRTDPGEGTGNPILDPVDLVDPVEPIEIDGGSMGEGSGELDPEAAVAVTGAGLGGRDRNDEVIEAVAIDVDLPDGPPHRRRGLGGGKTGSAKWVWITIGAIAVVAIGSVAIVAGTSGDKIPQTDLGVIRYPPEAP